MKLYRLQKRCMDVMSNTSFQNSQRHSYTMQLACIITGIPTSRAHHLKTHDLKQLGHHSSLHSPSLSY